MKKLFVSSILLAGALMFTASNSFCQDIVPSEEQPVTEQAAETQGGGGNVFYSVLFGSGTLGFLLWLALFGAFGTYIYLAIDCSILIRRDKIMPQELINNVEDAMREGDVVKALNFCENDPTPLARILSAGFSHVEEGFEVIDEAINSAGEVEVEKINQRLTWISVVSNISPMLGLLGTVQGMIMAFANLADGAPDVGMLAVNISQALWTTAGGLVCAIPAVTTYYAFRNKANNIVLQMTIMTSELIKDLRNVEVVSE